MQQNALIENKDLLQSTPLWELMQQNALIENKDLLQSTPLLTQRLL
jgi:hypothetical protein